MSWGTAAFPAGSALARIVVIIMTDQHVCNASKIDETLDEAALEDEILLPNRHP